MDLIFNELSVRPLAIDKTEGFNRVTGFLETFKRASEKNYNKIRFDVPNEVSDILSDVSITDDQTLADYRNILFKDYSNRRYGQLLMGLPKRPFIDENTEEENRYIQNSFTLLKDGINVEPFGLAVAYLYSTASIGFCSESFWEKCQFNLFVKGESESIESVFCASKPDHFNSTEYQNWLASIILNDWSGESILKLFSSISSMKKLRMILFF